MNRILAPLCFLLSMILLVAGNVGEALAQDFRVLRDRRPHNPNVNRVPASLPPVVVTPRVLIAGDSWAQFMWDDGSHNDLFDRYGHADKTAVSQSLTENPGPGHGGPEYAISGSEAREWVDTANFPWIANLAAALTANPTIDNVMLSLGGNDFLAGKSDGGWYKDMDLDVPGSEAVFFNQLETDSWAVINAALAVRPDITVTISSYDYPNFNVGFWCFLYACPKRDDLSRDPSGDLITDQEINAIMTTIETNRIGWAVSDPRVAYDNSLGLMHHFYGDGISGPGVLPRPGFTAPDYLPFPGGNVLRPTLRSNFRLASFLDADPIHLDYEGYQHKIAHQNEGLFFPEFRGDALATFYSEGGLRDGWSDGIGIGTTEIVVGDNGPSVSHGILSFDTSSLPDGAMVTGARLYLHRRSQTGSNPFETGNLGLPRVDIVSGSFGTPEVEAGDAFAAADFTDAGYVAGSVKANGYAAGVHIDSSALSAINPAGLTQIRIGFAAPGGGAGGDGITFADGSAGAPGAGFPSLASYMGTLAPFLDVSYDITTAVGDEPQISLPTLLPNSPNPFVRSTSIRFTLPERARVKLSIHDVAGRRVAVLRDGILDAGGYSVTWNGRAQNGAEVASGLYLARLEAGTYRSSRRIIRIAR